MKLTWLLLAAMLLVVLRADRLNALAVTLGYAAWLVKPTRPAERGTRNTERGT